MLLYENAVCQLTFTSTKCVTFEYSLSSLNEMNIWKVFLLLVNTVFGTVHLLVCEIVMETPISTLSRRWWRQQERQKGNRIRLAKQQFWECITLFCTFLCLISRFVEEMHDDDFLFSFPERQLAHFRVPPGHLYQNEVKFWAFDIEMMFHSQANTTHFHKKDYALGLILKVRIFETRKWAILLYKNSNIWRMDRDGISTIKFDVTFLVTFS